jgi:hypothetical protein
MRVALAATMLALLSACVEERTPQQAEKAVEAIEQDAIKQRQLSIEEAAEEATKLIEADAKTEIDELSSDQGTK